MEILSLKFDFNPSLEIIILIYHYYYVIIIEIIKTFQNGKH